jgi:hypothetical protein
VPVPAGAADAVGEAAGALGGAAELAGAVVAGMVTVLGVLGAPAVLAGEDADELVEELQAVNRTATYARDAQDAICRGLRTFVISMMSSLSINAVSQLRRGAARRGWKSLAVG